MNSILECLYSCATENRAKNYLSQDESRDFTSSFLKKEELQDELNELLEGESLRLFKLYQDNDQEAEYLESISIFRKGLAMGLKLGAFCTSEY